MGKAKGMSHFTFEDGTQVSYVNGNLHQKILPDGEDFTYWENGNVRYRTSADGHNQDFTPDGMLIHESYPSGLVRSWDRHTGMPTYLRNPNGKEFFWDEEGFLLRDIPEEERLERVPLP
ncbi:MAG: hypothetical protein GX256_02465 [Fretibacterium sp.]|nr:hypothetical protein [Fretibacterium sp.]